MRRLTDEELDRLANEVIDRHHHNAVKARTKRSKQARTNRNSYDAALRRLNSEALARRGSILLEPDPIGPEKRAVVTRRILDEMHAIYEKYRDQDLEAASKEINDVIRRLGPDSSNPWWWAEEERRELEEDMQELKEMLFPEKKEPWEI